jgi:hypothetical protein
MIIARSIFFRMRNILDDVVDKITISYSKLFPDNRAVYDIMWKIMVQPDRSHVEI